MNVKFEGYEHLQAVFDSAMKQAAEGKGKDRHANGLPFHDQRMQRISTLLNSPDGMAFQVAKKMTEGLQFTDPAKREAELLGAIVYLAGIVVWLRCRDNPVGEVSLTDFEVVYPETMLNLAGVPDWVMWVGVAPCGMAKGYVTAPKRIPETGGWRRTSKEVHYFPGNTTSTEGLYVRKGWDFVRVQLHEVGISPDG